MQVFEDKGQVRDKWLQTKRNERMKSLEKKYYKAQKLVHSCFSDYLYWEVQKIP